MKKIKINLLAIIGMMVAVGTVAFKAPKENLELVWFDVSNGIIQVDAEIEEGPGGDCIQSPAAETCMAAFDSADLDTNGHAPTSDLNSPLVKDRAYTDPE